MRMRLKRRGLTLLELMIVLIILVGLLAIVGPRLLESEGGHQDGAGSDWQLRRRL